MTATRHNIGVGQAGGLDTLHRMREIAFEQSASPLVRETAATIARDTGTNTAVQIPLIRKWLERHVDFLRDPLGTELLHTPEIVLAKLGTEGFVAVDCDDVAMLGAALGMSIGLRARFVMIGLDNHYEHVWAELSDPNLEEWYDLDITRPHQPDYSRYDLTLAVEV